jgi:sugar phosphate isomerase/epimerase
MNRRQFNGIMLSATIGTVVGPAWTNSKGTEHYDVRIGGPVFKQYNSPNEWIIALNELRYRAAYCPVGLDATADEIRAYKAAAQKENIVISEVGAWSNPIDPDSKKSKASIEKCIKSLKLADEIGANCCVNISGSRNPDNWAGPHKENLTQGIFDLIVETTRNIIDAVKPKNTFYALETMPWSYPDSVESYQRLIKAIDRKQFGVHLDPVNLITSPQVYFNNGELIKNAFKKLGPYIRSCHAKDIVLLDDKLTPHLPEIRAGLGNLDYAVFLQELSKLKDIPLMLEHLKTADEYHEAAEYIRTVGRGNNINF